MPLYEFMCQKCLKLSTKLLRINDKRKTVECTHCGRKTAERILSVPSGFDIKGFSEKNGYAGEKK